MFKSDALNQLGNQTQVAELLGIKPSAVSQWPELIPEKQAMRLERLTDGALQYDSALYEKPQSSQQSSNQEGQQA